jgi:hypothetical protein
VRITSIVWPIEINGLINQENVILTFNSCYKTFIFISKYIYNCFSILNEEFMLIRKIFWQYLTLHYLNHSFIQYVNGINFAVFLNARDPFIIVGRHWNLFSIEKFIRWKGRTINDVYKACIIKALFDNYRGRDNFKLVGILDFLQAKFTVRHFYKSFVGKIMFYMIEICDLTFH